jgi:hypothetical protein
MTDAPEPEEQRPLRWDSHPLGTVVPRWDAGVRYWPLEVMLVGVFVIFVALNIVFGFDHGPDATAAVIASYSVLLIVLPIRKHLVPREIGTSASRAPMRLWVLGWLLLAAAVACEPLGVNVSLNSGNQLPFFAADALCYVLIVAGVLCIARAPAWVQWRQRPRTKRRPWSVR